MADRPVFITANEYPFFRTEDIEFTWNSGLAVSQKQKNICAVHENFLHQYPERKILEISSKSMQEGGREMSAMNLLKYVPDLKKRIPVENIYQAGKVFENGGPYKDLLEVASCQAKKDERLKNSGKIQKFVFGEKEFPFYPKSLFYNYIYISALFENEELLDILLQYDSFTDIEFNPKKGISSQAQAAAICVALINLGWKEEMRDPVLLLKLLNNGEIER